MENKWKNRFVRLMISQGISMLGSSVVSLAITWYVTLLTGSGVAVAAVAATTFLPQLLVLLPGGILADRHSSKWIIVISDSSIAVSTLVLAGFFFMGWDNLGWILFFNSLRSFGSGIQMPAVRSILPELVPEDYFMKANGISTGIWSVISLVSPALGGFMMEHYQMQYVLLLDVITAAIGTTILITISFAIKEKSSVQTHPWLEIKDGLQYLYKEKRLKNSVIYYSIFQFLIMPASMLIPLLASINLKGNIMEFTLMEMAFSIGAMLICLVMAWKTFPVRHFTLIGCSAILFGITMVWVSSVHVVWIFMLLMLLMGMGSPLYYTPLITYIQENTKEEYMGRVFSFVDLFATMATPLGMLLFGTIADVSIWLAFVIPGIGLVLLGLGALIITRNTAEGASSSEAA